VKTPEGLAAVSTTIFVAAPTFPTTAAASTTAFVSAAGGDDDNNTAALVAVPVVIVVLILILLVAFFITRRRAKRVEDAHMAVVPLSSYEPEYGHPSEFGDTHSEDFRGRLWSDVARGGGPQAEALRSLNQSFASPDEDYWSVSELEATVLDLRAAEAARYPHDPYRQQNDDDDADGALDDLLAMNDLGPGSADSKPYIATSSFSAPLVMGSFHHVEPRVPEQPPAPLPALGERWEEEQYAMERAPRTRGEAFGPPVALEMPPVPEMSTIDYGAPLLPVAPLMDPAEEMAIKAVAEELVFLIMGSAYDIALDRLLERAAAERAERELCERAEERRQREEEEEREEQRRREREEAERREREEAERREREEEERREREEEERREREEEERREREEEERREREEEERREEEDRARREREAQAVSSPRVLTLGGMGGDEDGDEDEDDEVDDDADTRQDPSDTYGQALASTQAAPTSSNRVEYDNSEYARGDGDEVVYATPTGNIKTKAKDYADVEAEAEETRNILETLHRQSAQERREALSLHVSQRSSTQELASGGTAEAALANLSQSMDKLAQLLAGDEEEADDTNESKLEEATTRDAAPAPRLPPADSMDELADLLANESEEEDGNAQAPVTSTPQAAKSVAPPLPPSDSMDDLAQMLAEDGDDDKAETAVPTPQRQQQPAPPPLPPADSMDDLAQMLAEDGDDDERLPEKPQSQATRVLAEAKYVAPEEKASAPANAPPQLPPSDSTESLAEIRPPHGAAPPPPPPDDSDSENEAGGEQPSDEAAQLLERARQLEEMLAAMNSDDEEEA
jgi:hypothetical protein